MRRREEGSAGEGRGMRETECEWRDDARLVRQKAVLWRRRVPRVILIEPTTFYPLIWLAVCYFGSDL